MIFKLYLLASFLLMLTERDLILKGADGKLKLEYHPISRPIIPFIHHLIILLVTERQKLPLQGEPKPGRPLDLDIYF